MSTPAIDYLKSRFPKLSESELFIRTAEFYVNELRYQTGFDNALSPLQSKIVDLLFRGGPLSATEIANLMNSTPQHLQNPLMALCNNKIILKTVAPVNSRSKYAYRLHESVKASLVSEEVSQTDTQAVEDDSPL